MPKEGDIKTFPNGKRGVWDGVGWEHIPSPTEDAASARTAPPATQGRPPGSHAGEPYVGDKSTEPGDFWSGATKHMLTEEPAALGALGTGAAMVAGAVGLPAAGVTALTSAAPAVGHGVTRLARLLAGEEQKPFGVGEAWDIASGPGMTYGPRAVGGIAKGVANSPVGQKIIGTLGGSAVGTALGHPFIGTHIGSTQGVTGTVKKVAEGFSSAGEGTPGASMAKLHEFLSGKLQKLTGGADEAAAAAKGSGNFVNGPFVHKSSPNFKPVVKPGTPGTPSTPGVTAPRARVSTPSPSNWEGGSGSLGNYGTRLQSPSEVHADPESFFDAVRRVNTETGPTVASKSPVVGRSSPSAPGAGKSTLSEMPSMEGKTKVRNAKPGTYKVEKTVLKNEFKASKKDLPYEFSPAMKGLEEANTGSEFPKGWTKGGTKSWNEAGADEAEAASDASAVRSAQEKIRKAMGKK